MGQGGRGTGGLQCSSCTDRVWAPDLGLLGFGRGAPPLQGKHLVTQRPPCKPLALVNSKHSVNLTQPACTYRAPTRCPASTGCLALLRELSLPGPPSALGLSATPEVSQPCSCPPHPSLSAAPLSPLPVTLGQGPTPVPLAHLPHLQGANFQTDSDLGEIGVGGGGLEQRDLRGHGSNERH